MSRPVYVTTSTPYVNASPHVGFGLELVLADALARYHRLTGAPTRLQSGTDENSLKNVQAAEREGVTVRSLVDRNARLFQDLPAALDVELDGFIRTSADRAHAAGAAALWGACAKRGDLYRRRYRGLYCVSCERFYAPDELVGDRCPVHGTPPDTVDEENWFFRLSRYQEELLDLLDGGRVRVLPETRCREARAFVAAGLEDISVSRSRERARGWGIPVPDDPDQVMYVWFDALASYVTALGYPGDGDEYRTFWEHARSVHVIGKDILRFHAVYWPAFLLSAGLPPPDTILVHGFLQAGGEKLSKSRGLNTDPAVAAGRAGPDALRYWLLRGVGSGEDADWTEERVRDLRTTELANELGNLLQRTVTMVRSYRAGAVPAAAAPDGCPLPALAGDVVRRLHAAMAERLDPQTALLAMWELVRACNRYASETRLSHLARQHGQPGLDGVLLALVESLRMLAEALRPFLPATAAEAAAQLGFELGADWPEALSWQGLAAGVRVGEPRPLFPRASAPGQRRLHGAGSDA